MSTETVVPIAMTIVSVLSIAATSIGIDMHNNCDCKDKYETSKGFLILILIVNILAALGGVGVVIMNQQVNAVASLPAY